MFAFMYVSVSPTSLVLREDRRGHHIPSFRRLKLIVSFIRMLQTKPESSFRVINALICSVSMVLFCQTEMRQVKAGGRSCLLHLNFIGTPLVLISRKVAVTGLRAYDSL